jgi:hypothetical protein
MYRTNGTFGANKPLNSMAIASFAVGASDKIVRNRARFVLRNYNGRKDFFGAPPFLQLLSFTGV